MNETSSLRVLIDDGLTSKGRKTGIGQHSENIALHLKELTHCTMTGFPIVQKVPRYFRKWAYIATCNISSRFDQYDLVHHMNHYVPLRRGKSKHVATIHDLSALRYPETISLAWRHYNRFSLRKAVERADALITVSLAIRDELLDTFPHMRPENIFVCSSGLREFFLNGSPSASSLEQLGLKAYSYLLFVGDLSKRKNVAFLLKSFLKAKHDNRLHSSTKLVLVGKKGWGYSDFSYLLRGTNEIRLLDYVPDHLLPSLYHHSKALVFPSLYEGFGSPIIEAMSQGIPIIISNIPTSVELNNAHRMHMLVFELEDEKTFTCLLEQVDAEWEKLRGRINYGDLTKYHYENIAKEHLKVYLKVCKESPDISGSLS